MSDPYSGDDGLLDEPEPGTIAALQDSLGDSPAVVYKLVREMVDLQVVTAFTVEGEPASKARARWDAVRGGRPYTPDATRTAQTAIGWHFRKAAGPLPVSDTATYGVMCVFFCGTRQRRDVDNMIKLVMDGLTGLAWEDDSQVTELSGRTVHRTAVPRTEVLIYRVGDAPAPTRRCEHCGKNFTDYPSQRSSRRYCDRACGAAARRKRLERVCTTCGGTFSPKPSTVPPSGQMSCSSACRKAGALAKIVVLTCEACGKEFTRRPSEVARGSSKTCSVACRMVIRRGGGVQ